MVCMLFLSWVTAICVIVEAELHPIETQDLKSIVDSVKKDVDRHLKMASASRLMESTSFPNPLEYDKSAVVEDIDEFMKMIHDSMHHHLVRNLGQPSDEKSSGSPTVENMASIPRQSSKNTEGSSEAPEIRVGSAKGIPGIHFPDYTDIPITSFTCSDKTNLPGFYADLDTGCQVFHVCWPDRRESFLCPMGTIFNQAFLVCDYWYNSNCSLAPHYYTVNAEMEVDSSYKNESTSSMINTLLENTDSVSVPKPDSSTTGHPTATSVISFVSQFMPIKAKIVIYPETENRRSKIVTSASIGDNKNLFKSRSHKKSHKSQKRPRVRRSLVDHYECSEHDCLYYVLRDFIDPFKTIGMDESYAKVLQFRFSEALDHSLMDIKSNETLSPIAGDVEKLVESIKFWLMLEDQPEFLELESRELYEYDNRLQEVFQLVHNRTNQFLILLASIRYNFDKVLPIINKAFSRISEDDLNRKSSEPPQLFSELAPLFYLNPKFIVNPATEEAPLFQDDELLRVKRAATILHPLTLKHKRVSIYPGTKTALLKNYVKLFKTKRI